MYHPLGSPPRRRCLKAPTPLPFTTTSTTSETARRMTFSKIRTRAFQSLGPIKLLFPSLLRVELPSLPLPQVTTTTPPRYFLPRPPQLTCHHPLLRHQVSQVRVLHGGFLFAPCSNGSSNMSPILQQTRHKCLFSSPRHR